MAEKNIYVKVTVDAKGEITVNSSVNKEVALKLLNEGITVCIDSIIEDKKVEVPGEIETEVKVLETE